MSNCTRFVTRLNNVVDAGEPHRAAAEVDVVKDPVALVLFPRAEAWASTECGGRTYYFIGEATRAAFAIQNRLLGL